MVFSVCCHARQVWSTKQQFLYAHPSGPFTTQCCSGMNQQTCANTPLDISSFFFFFCFLFFVLFGQAFLRLVMRTQRALERGWDSSLVLLGMCCWEFEIGPTQIPRGGGTDLEKGYGDVRPWRPPFHASSAARKGPISSKRVRLQDPL